MHIPFQMMQANMPLVEFIRHDMKHLIMTAITHIYFIYIFTRDNNVIAPTITHAIFNFCRLMFIKS